MDDSKCRDLITAYNTFDIIGEFISIWTIPLLKTKRRALPSAGNGPMPYRPRPVHPRRLFPRPGPERFRHVRVPALSMTHLLSLCLLTNELLK